MTSHSEPAFGKDVTGAMLTMERAAKLATKKKCKAAHLELSAWVMHSDDGEPKAVVVFADAPPVVRYELLWAGKSRADILCVPLFVAFDDGTRVALPPAIPRIPRLYYVGELGLMFDTSKIEVPA